MHTFWGRSAGDRELGKEGLLTEEWPPGRQLSRVTPPSWRAGKG